MPIIKSAIKRERQVKRKTEGNRHYKTKMQTFYKKIRAYVEAWDKDSALKFLSETFSIIDTASKKNVIHKNNAARKKSKLARLVSWQLVVNKKEKLVKKDANKNAKKQLGKQEKKVEAKVEVKVEKELDLKSQESETPAETPAESPAESPVEKKEDKKPEA